MPHTRRHHMIALIALLALALLGYHGTASAAPRTHPNARPISAARARAVIAIIAPTTCNWADGLLVTFDTREIVCVGLGFNTRPTTGPIDSFWRAYWSREFPFYHQGGFTQNGTPDRIYYTEL